ncbi:hypothetical protein GF373_00030 [bacterium]|nr:hypothetical protein [bacterium]
MLKILSFICLLAISAAGDDPAALFKEAETLARQNQNAAAMAKVEEAVKELDRAHAANEDIRWQGRNGLRFAAKLARENFLDYKKALFFSDKLFELADNEYWRVPARLDRALTYRAMGDFEKAQQEYDAIAQTDERYRKAAMLPQAEMVYFDMGEKQRGKALLLAALQEESINGRERFNTLRACAEQAMIEGRREKALAWYALFETLPFENADVRTRYLSRVWYEMGQIQESLGRTAEAKNSYRKAMKLENGEMRYRARARDALESIEYFE